MHDYDRRLLASSTDTETVESYWPLEVGKVIAETLRQYQARLDDYKARQINDHTVEADGKTTDGRTFKAEISIFLKGANIYTRTQMHVDGAALVKPMPEAVAKMEVSVSEFLEVLKATDSDPRAHRNVVSRFRDYLQPLIKTWQSGGVVDTKSLRSSLRAYAKDIENVRKQLGSPHTIPAGEARRLWDLADATRKSIGAAARSITDVDS